MSRRSLSLGGTCTKGHVLTEQNTYKYPDTAANAGKLVCKICRRDATRKAQGLSPADPNEPLENWVRDKDRKKTHCPQGHPYDDENTRFTTSGGRRCKICDYNRNRTKQFKDKYGLTVEEYEIMLLNQNDSCAICGWFAETLAVDHDHETGKVRGLLCNNCNNGLGRFKDDTKSLKNAILYLEAFASTN